VLALLLLLLLLFVRGDLGNAVEIRLPVGVMDLFMLVAVGSAKLAVESRDVGCTDRAFAVLDDDDRVRECSLPVVV